MKEAKPETETPKIPTPEQFDESRRQAAAVILQKHFSSHPDAAIVVSMKEGRIQCDISPFPDLAALCLGVEIMKRQFNISMENSLSANRRQAQAAEGVQ